jgi:hypothetical protein
MPEARGRFVRFDARGETLYGIPGVVPFSKAPPYVYAWPAEPINRAFAAPPRAPGPKGDVLSGGETP